MADVDGLSEDRRRTQSVFNGPSPTVAIFDTEERERSAVAEWILARRREGLAQHEIAVFVRSDAQIGRARAAVEQTQEPWVVLGADMDTNLGSLSIATMHQAKGLEFRAVAVVACDDEILPSQERIESVAEEAGLEEVYDTERHLLYVACTRARDHLLVTGVAPGSEFLEDLRA
jgi:superfamily I DNA/RNA helicase